MAPESPTLQNEYSDKFSADVGERLQDLDRRVREGKLERAKIRAVLDQVKTQTDAKFAEFQSKFQEFDADGVGRVNAEQAKKLAAYTIASADTGIKDAEGHKIYRTQMVSKISEYLLAHVELNTASVILEAGMAALKYRNGTIEKSLWDAMRMVPDPKMLQGPKKRQELAKKMATGERDLALGKSITLGGKTYTVGKVEILTGAAMTSFDPELLTSLKIQDAVIIETNGKKQIWARMQNGCQGNLVIVDITETDTPPAAPPSQPEGTPKYGQNKWEAGQGYDFFAKIPEEPNKLYRKVELPGKPVEYAVVEMDGKWNWIKIPESDLPPSLKPAATEPEVALLPGEDPAGQNKFEKITKEDEWAAVEGGEAGWQYAKTLDATDTYYAQKETAGQPTEYKMAELTDNKWIWKSIPENDLPLSLKTDPEGEVKFKKIITENEWMDIEGGEEGWQYAKIPGATDKYYVKKEVQGQETVYQMKVLKNGKWYYEAILEEELPTTLLPAAPTPDPAETLPEGTEADFNRLTEEHKKLAKEFKEKGGNDSDLDVSSLSDKTDYYSTLGVDTTADGWSPNILEDWSRADIEKADSTTTVKEIDPAKFTAASTIISLENAILQTALDKIKSLPPELTLLPSHEQTSDVAAVEARKTVLDTEITGLKELFKNTAISLENLSYFSINPFLVTDQSQAARDLNEALKPTADPAINEEEYRNSLYAGVGEHDYDFPGVGEIFGLIGEDNEIKARTEFVNNLLQACRSANVVPPRHPKELGGVFEKKGDWKASPDIGPEDIRKQTETWINTKRGQKEGLVAKLKETGGNIIQKEKELEPVTKELDFEKNAATIGLLKGAIAGEKYTVEEKTEGSEKTYHIYYRASADGDPEEVLVQDALHPTDHPDIFWGGTTWQTDYYLKRDNTTGQISFKSSDADVEHMVLQSKDNTRKLMAAPPVPDIRTSEFSSSYGYGQEDLKFIRTRMTKVQDGTYSESYTEPVSKLSEGENKDLKQIGEILGDSIGNHFSIPERLWFGTLALLKGPQKFLQEEGEEFWQRAKKEVDAVWDTPEEKKGLRVAIDHALESTAIGKIDFNAQLIGKELSKQASTLKEEHDTNGTSAERKQEIAKWYKDNLAGRNVEWVSEHKFMNPNYENEWNGIQKFCYRREKQLPGFTAWMRGKLEEYKKGL